MTERLARPPGLLFTAFAVLAVIAALDAYSRLSFFMWIFAMAMCFFVAAAWLTRLIAMAVHRDDGNVRSPGSRVSHMFRWLAIPALLFGAFLATRGTFALDARFELSRGALDQAAAELTVGESRDPGWVGLFPMRYAARTAHGAAFALANTVFTDGWFIYSTMPEPDYPFTDEGDSWYPDDVVRPLGGGWWFYEDGSD